MRAAFVVLLGLLLAPPTNAAEVCVTIPDAAVSKVQEACTWYSNVNSIDPPVQGAACARQLLRHHIRALLAGKKRFAGEQQTRDDERAEYQAVDGLWPE